MHSYLSVFFILIAMAASAQNRPPSNYTRDWKRADSLAKKGLPQSALEIANRIYKEAKAARNYPQVAKAAMYRMTFRNYSDEQGYKELIYSLRADVVDTPEPARSVIQSVLADAYWQYFQQNRYKFYNRTTVGRGMTGKGAVNPAPGNLPKPADSTADFTTWDAHQLVDAVTTAFLASVQEKNSLQKTPVATYEALVTKGDADARPLRPMLYDLLAHRAIEFFQNTEPDLLKPVFRFELDQPDYLAGPDVFAKLPIESRDSLSGRFQALRLFQQLITFHLADANPDALADVDALRLAFVHQHSTAPTKDTLYRQSLEKQIVQYKNTSNEAVYAYQLAQFLASSGNQIRPVDEDGNGPSEQDNATRWNRKQAADICRDLVNRFPKTIAGRQVAPLLNQLLTSTFSVQVEAVNMPGQPFRALINYQNVSRLAYRIVKLSTLEMQTYANAFRSEDERKKLYDKWLKRSKVAENKVTLPDDGDLNNHSVEIPIAGLPLGHYVVLATTENAFREKMETVQFATFSVSALGYILRGNNQPTQTLFVTNRLTGEPVKNADVAVVGETTLVPIKGRNSSKTNADGRVEIVPKAMPQQRNFYYLISSGTDTLLTQPQYVYGNAEGQPDEQSQTYAKLFTDRAIYRPGQPIYVKGLLYEGKTNQFAVAAGRTVDIELLDQNGEQVGKQTMRTNEFGTFTANFTAPVGRLTGLMTLQTPFGGFSIRVEEYKRPTFEVKAKSIRQAFKLGQTVSLTAEAKTFSGAVVDGADVRYRVMRKLRPRWDWWYRGGGPRANNQAEIASGIAQTDAQGNVSVSFTATPDREKSREENTIFDFEVTIDVTDRAGETRSTTQTLRIGYSALQLTLAIPAQVDVDTPAPFPIRVTNQAGEKVSATGKLSVYRLQPPARPLRNRLWSRPDRQFLSRDEFGKLFPTDLYANENDPRSWPKGELVQQTAIKTRVDSSGVDSLIKPDISRYTPGEYVAELTVTDSTGETAKEQTFFAVVNDKQPTASARPDNWVQIRKAIAEPGEEAVFYVGNSLPGWMLMMVEENGKIVRQEWLKTSGKPRRVTLPVTEKQRGGFAVHFAMVQNGRLYQKSQGITVPFTNKQLTIETKTFRTKLKPGEREEWTLTIGGLDKNPAELVATLYDASLDAFGQLDWPTDVYQAYSPMFYGWQSESFSGHMSNALFYTYRPGPAVTLRKYDQLAIENGGVIIRLQGYSRREVTGAVSKMAIGGAVAAAPMQDGFASEAALNEVVTVGYGENKASNATKGSKPDLSPVINPRRNFNETAFFLPQLKTDEQGRAVLKFTMPESTTRWRLLTFAHTKDLKTGTLEREIITQKELMITANAPRFLREGDTIRLTARINNLTDKSLPVLASLALMDALTGEPINQKLIKANLQSSVMVAAGQGQVVGWTLVIPAGLETVTCRLTAQSGNFTDGEEFTVPVLPNRTLITDTKPFWVNGKDKKEFRLTELTNLNPELPAQHERLTVEVTSNPAWYALQSLPYLMEYRYECAEQLFSRLYANSLAAYIVNSKPAFKQVIAEWQKTPPRSPLQSNEELKAITLENSPWLADARSEAERQAKLGQLLDANRVEAEQVQAFEKLRQLQTASGGFQWFGGMEPNLPMTLHILGGFGHLQKLGRSAGAVPFSADVQAKLSDMQTNAIRYVDAQMKQWVEIQKKAKVAGMWDFSATQYLYARSFYLDTPLDKSVLAYLKQRIADGWPKQSLQGQALSAMALHRLGDEKTATDILKSLNERARKSEEMGMYWPDNQSGLYWYQTPIETQAYLIEAFDEIKPNRTTIDDMKRWLIRQKQTQSWSSTKATTEAVYALLLRGSDWLTTGATTQVTVGGQSIESRVTKTETITGYQKVTYAAAEIKPELGVIQVTKTADGPAWGALYWQHFEPLDRVMPGSAGLSVQKALYVQHDSPGGPVITPVSSQTSLKPGDLIKVRLVLKTDRAMEYVHLKDSRASGFEPIAALSGYKYQNGLGYYESPRDASTDFFMSYLPVGTHVFEYDLRVAQTGDFSAGVATVQCFYAPEFSAHSAGERVRVK